MNWFVLPSEIGNMYARAGQEKPVRGATGFWNLIPLIGFIIWVVKVQNALNRVGRPGRRLTARAQPGHRSTGKYAVGTT